MKSDRVGKNEKSGSGGYRGRKRRAKRSEESFERAKGRNSFGARRLGRASAGTGENLRQIFIFSYPVDFQFS
jgi:hypothetical protein